MADEEKEHLEEEENQDAGDSEEENSEDADDKGEEESGDEGDEGGEPQKEDEGEEEQEFWDDDEEYLRHLGVSEDIKTIEDLAKKYEELRTQPKPEEVPPEKEKPSDAQPIFKRNMMSSHVNDMVKRGVLGDAKVQESYRSMARFIDDAMNPFVEQMENNTNLLAGGYLKVVKNLREDSWRKFRGKHKNIKRDSLDKYMNEHGLLDYRDAYRYHVIKDPEAFGEFTKTIGRKEDNDKKFRPRRTSIKGGRRTATRVNDAIWKPYLRKETANLHPVQQELDTNTSEWNGMDIEKRSKIVDGFLEYQNKHKK